MKQANKTLRDNLIMYMEKAGVCDSELSQRLNLHRTTVSKYTSGKSLPSIPTLWMIARMLNTSMDELMDGYTEEEYYNGSKN